MAYTVLARRYRSQSFDDVVGQEVIGSTLKNAIKSGRVAHAYLFTGTRGVGKTSMARIFARALNAPDTVDDAPKPEGDDHAYPADDVQQRMADAIMRGDDLNVIEIDGASNRGVDDARDIIAKAGLSPTDNARYKIYIIDEVHMLTREAFNALLKIMEEPPAHVKFILCTTESHKIPATIHSRCQRFDFKNIPTAQIKAHLANVVKTEGVKADDEVLYQVAVLGNGSMRDALSLMDRVIATDKESLTVDLLEKMLGLPPRQAVVELVDALANGDLSKTLELADQTLNAGIGQEQLIEVIVERLRQLMLIAACGIDSPLIELSDDAKQAAAAQAKRFDAPGLVHMIALCEGLSHTLRTSSNPRALIDAALVRLALSEKMADVTAILAGGGAAIQGGVEQKKKIAAIETALPAKPQAADTRPRGSEPVVDLGDPQKIWQALHTRLSEKSSFAWVDDLRLSSLDAERGVCVLAPKIANRDLTRVANPRQRERLAQELSDLTETRFRVELEAAAPAPQSDPVGTRQAPIGGDRQKAMSLPLVRDVLGAFPEAVLISTRRENTGNTPAPKPQAPE